MANSQTSTEAQIRHQFYSAKEALSEGGEDSKLYRNVAEGGLAVCKVCRCFEGSLASECPGEPASGDQQDRIYNREIDFIGGEWIVLAGKPAGDC